MNTWYRVWHGMPTDPKFRVIARRSGASVPEVMAVFVVMMDRASQAESRGTLEGWDDEDAAAGLDMDAEQVFRIREAMQGKLLDGDRLSGWDKRQPQRDRDDDSTKRVRDFRARKKAEPVVAAQDVTPCNASVTPCNAMKRHETPPDTDTEKEYISTTPVHNYSTQPVETAREGGEALQAGGDERRTERVPVTVPNAVRSGESIADETLPVDDDPFDPRGPRPVAQDSPVPWDWAKLAEKVRGNQRVDALYLARTLAAADQDPARRHWRGALNQLICDGKPDYVAGFAAYHLRRWTSGQAAPPSPPPPTVRYFNDNPEAREYERQLRERGELQMPGESTLDFFTRKLRQRGVTVPDAESFGGAQ